MGPTVMSTYEMTARKCAVLWKRSSACQWRSFKSPCKKEQEPPAWNGFVSKLPATWVTAGRSAADFSQTASTDYRAVGELHSAIQAFSVAGPMVWNSLPSTDWLSRSVRRFCCF